MIGLLFLICLIVILVRIAWNLAFPEKPPRGRHPATLFWWIPAPERAVACIIWLLVARLCENVPFLYGYRLFSRIFQWQYLYGTFRADFGPKRRVIVVDDPLSLQHMLQTNFDNYVRPEINVSLFEPVLGGGIFNANGWSWKFQRTTARPFFKAKAIEENMLHVFQYHTDNLCDVLASAARSGKVVDMQELFNRFTLDSILEVAFGVSIGSLDRDVPFNRAFNRIIHELAFREENPFWPLFFWRETQFRKDLDTINNFVTGIIENLKSLSDSERRSRQGLLASFMNLEDKLTDTFLRDICVNFLLAGRDTTSQLLTWCTYFVARSPAVEARLVDELQGEQASGYMKAVLNETLRIVPPVPLEGRQAVEDDVLPNGVFVPRGWLVAYAGPVYHRLENLWGPDTNQFNPDRFLPPRSSSIRPYQFLAFHGGEQRCLGQAMAYEEASICFGQLMKSFSFEVAEQPMATRGLTIFAAKGMMMRVHKRADVPLKTLQERAKHTEPYDLRLQDRFAWERK